MGAFIQPHSACHSTNNSWKLHAQHTNTCLLLPLCGLCRAHVAKTKVRMRLGVSSMCHAGTNKQHSIARGGGGCGAATRTVTHPPPLSHQHKQATTSLQLLARGRWCGCVKHASPPPSPPTPTHLMTQQWRSVGGREEEEEEEEVEWEGQPPAAPMGAITATRHHSCTAVPAHAE